MPTKIRLKPTTAFGRRLRQWRQSQFLTQAELARLAGVPPDLISRLESGATDYHRVTLLSLERLATALGRPLAEIVAPPGEPEA